MEQLVLGVPASRVFRALQEENATIDARELGYILTTAYPKISPAASISIRKWLNTASSSEFPDEQIDEVIKRYLILAGYVA